MKKVITFGLSILAASVLVGCGSNNDSNNGISPLPIADAISADYQGYWQAPGYGLSLEVGASTVTLYQYTSDYCFVMTDETDVDTVSLERIVRLTDSVDTLEWYTGTGTDTFGPPGYRFDKMSSLPTSCAQNPISISPTFDNDFDTTELFDMYAQIFDEYYVDFERMNVNWSDVVQSTGAELTANSSSEALFEAMAYALEPLADGHNYVASPEGLEYKVTTKPTMLERLVEDFAHDNNLDFPISGDVVTPTLIAQLEGFLLDNLSLQWQIVTSYAQEADDIKSTANDAIRWFENDGLGYLFIGTMLGYAESAQDELTFSRNTLAAVDAALDEALLDLQNVDGLIIDVRTNDGGFDYVSMAIASRFAQEEFHAFSKQARDGNSRTELLDINIAPRSEINYVGPIVVLTSSSTVSAAETFTMIMDEMPNVTLIGEATHGALSNVLEWTLPNGFTIGLSNEFYLTPNGEWYEGTGIPVDIEVPFFTREQREQGIDLGIEAAAAYLLN
jgi:hypothetical protein